MNKKITDDLAHIRSMMERSSRFISLSGISGIVAGIIGVVTGFWASKMIEHTSRNSTQEFYFPQELVLKLILLGGSALFLALAFGIFFTVRKSKKQGLSIWTSTTKSILMHLFTPLLVGGIFCLALIHYQIHGLVAGTMLVFYGLALVSAEKFTFSDVKYLGFCEIILGLISLFWIGKGLLFWTIGFGFMHIIYGIILYKKYK